MSSPDRIARIGKTGKVRRAYRRKYRKSGCNLFMVALHWITHG